MVRPEELEKQKEYVLKMAIQWRKYVDRMYKLEDEELDDVMDNDEVRLYDAIMQYEGML